MDTEAEQSDIQYLTAKRKLTVIDQLKLKGNSANLKHLSVYTGPLESYCLCDKVV